MGQNHYCYDSYKVYLCGGRIYSLYVDVTVVLAWYVLSLSVCRAPWRRHVSVKTWRSM